MGWVRIELMPQEHRCAVVGTFHRLPVERSVSLDTALALWRSGVPTVIRRHGNSQTVVFPERAGSG